MPRGNNRTDCTRRNLLKLAGVGTITALAGCSGGGGEGGGNGGNGGSGGGNGSGGSGGDGGGSGGSGTTAQDNLGNTLVGPNGNQVELNLVWSTGGSTTETLVQFLKQEYAKMGLNVTLNGTTFDNMLAQYAQNTFEGTTTFNAGPRDQATSAEQWDLMAGIGFNAYPRTPPTISTFWTDVAKTQQAATNFYGYKPSEPLGELFSQGASQTDEAARQETFARIFGVLSKDQPVNFLQFDTDLNGFQNNVSVTSVGPAFGYDSQKWAFADANGPVGGPYTSGEAADATTLNPLRIADTSSDARVGLTLDGAYELTNDDEFFPLWFESYETNDQQTYRFQLRDNLQWGGDYGQMTAEDWVYYIQEVRQAEDNWAGDVNATDWFVGDTPIPVEQTGELSFEVRLPEVNPFFIREPVLWGMYCLPRGLVEPYREESDGEGLNQDPAIQQLQYTGNLGPYTFERWERNSVFEATRNEEYYRANTGGFQNAPHFERSSLQVFGEESTRLGAFQSGDITASAIPPARAKEFQNNNSTKVVQTPSAFCNMLVYNQRGNGWEELKKAEVRTALSMGVNKTVIVDRINRGFANIAHTHQPEYSEFYDDSQVTRTGAGDSYSTARAKQMLNEALPNNYNYEG